MKLLVKVSLFHNQKLEQMFTGGTGARQGHDLEAGQRNQLAYMSWAVLLPAPLARDALSLPLVNSLGWKATQKHPNQHSFLHNATLARLVPVLSRVTSFKGRLGLCRQVYKQRDTS